ncbi:MAG: hypothetical protein K0B08_12390 [Bacteroidales bacterium]|nr:hypothetical protein [Bacteroidales bacterium]
MPPQIKRLLLLFGLFIGLFLLARYLLIPESFGKYGHYRGNSLYENMELPIQYAGSESCTECHADVADDKESDIHDNLSCESCHGPSLAHVNASETIGVEKPSGREFCGLCHSRHSARDRNVVFQIDLAEHNADKDCIECHNPHKPWDLKEQDTPEEAF